MSDGSVNTNALLRGVCGFPVISDLTGSVVKELDLSVIYPDGSKQEYSKKNGTLKYDASSIIVEGLSAGMYSFELKIVTTFSTYEAKGNGQISSASNRPIVLKVEKVTPHIVLYSDNATGNDEFYFAPDPENSKVVYKVGGLTCKETSSDPQKQLFTFDKQGRFYYMGTLGQLKLYDGLSDSGILPTQGAFCVDKTNNHLYYTTNNSSGLKLNASVIKKVGIYELEGSTGQAFSPGNVFSCLAYFDDYVDNPKNGAIRYDDKRYIVGYHVKDPGTTTAKPSVRLYCTTELTATPSGNIKITEAASSGDMDPGTNIAYDIAMVKKSTGEVKIFVLMHNGSPTSPAHQAMGNYTVTIDPSYQHVITGETGNTKPKFDVYNNSEGGGSPTHITGQRFLGHRGTKLYIAGKGTDSGNIIVFDYEKGTKKKIPLLGFKDEDGNDVTISF